jgi:hypothetical protein
VRFATEEARISGNPKIADITQIVNSKGFTVTSVLAQSPVANVVTCYLGIKGMILPQTGLRVEADSAAALGGLTPGMVIITATICRSQVKPSCSVPVLHQKEF